MIQRLMILFLLEPAWPQADSPGLAPPAPPGSKVAVTGTVVHAITKQPLKKAEVRLNVAGRGRSQVTTTGEDGHFLFPEVEPGTYLLTGRRNGFVDPTRPGTRGLNGIRLEVGAQDVTGLRVELMPQAIVAGRVVDEEGEPLQGILVQAVSNVSYRGQRRLQPIHAAQTDDRGEFRILNLNPGSYLLQVSPGRWGGGAAAAANTDPSLGYVAMYYPGVTDPRLAQKIRVTAGAELSGFQLRLTRARVVTVRGRILDPSGQPLRRFFLQLTPKDSPMVGFLPPQMSRLADGTFEVRSVLPGSYVLIVRTEANPRGSLGYREPLEVGDRDLEDLVIRLTPPVTVRGQVFMANDALVELSRLRVSITDHLTLAGAATSSVQPDGTFQLDNVPQGSYQLTVTVPEGIFVESLRAGEQEILGQPLVVNAAGAPPLQIRLSGETGALGGVVLQDGRPLGEAKVLLLPADKALWSAGRVRTVTADAYGRFLAANVPPGDYSVYAFTDLEPNLWEDEDEFRRFESSAKKVTIRRKMTETIELRPAAGG